MLTQGPCQERVFTYYFQNLQKHKMIFSNTDNFTLQYFLFADFMILNLTWDLKVGVSRIRKDLFQGFINDLEISLIYFHTDEMVYSKMCHIVWENWALQEHCYINGWFHQLRVGQRPIYKRSICIGIEEWCINEGVIL